MLGAVAEKLLSRTVPGNDKVVSAGTNGSCCRICKHLFITNPRLKINDHLNHFIHFAQKHLITGPGVSINAKRLRLLILYPDFRCKKTAKSALFVG